MIISLYRKINLVKSKIKKKFIFDIYGKITETVLKKYNVIRYDYCGHKLRSFSTKKRIFIVLIFL